MTPKKIFFMLISIAVSARPCSALSDELVVIKEVSNTGKSFAIRRGLKDGVIKGQEALFSTQKISLTANAQEVSGNFSVWRITSGLAVSGFTNGESVIFNNATDLISSQLTQLKMKSIEKVAGNDNFSRYSRNEDDQVIKIKKYHWLIRGSLSYALSESATDTSIHTDPQRQGFQLEGLYNYLLSPSLEYNIGLRYDREIINIQEPELSILNTRLFAVSDFNYRFSTYDPRLKNTYIGVGLGIGTSSTDIDDSSSSGFSLLMPLTRIGFELDTTPKCIFEASIESLISFETFETGDKQRTHILNSKFSMGVKF